MWKITLAFLCIAVTSLLGCGADDNSSPPLAHAEDTTDMDAHTGDPPVDTEQTPIPQDDGSENELLLNDGSGRFSSVAGVDAAAATGRSMDAVAVDLDGDSDLDLYVLNVGNNELLINNGAA